jgi:hypothetical protein
MAGSLVASIGSAFWDLWEVCIFINSAKIYFLLLPPDWGLRFMVKCV